MNYKSMILRHPRVVGILSLVAAIILLEGLILGNLISRFLLPPPSDVIAALPRLIAEQGILFRFAVTFYEVAIACALMTILGVSVGALLHAFTPLHKPGEAWLGAFASAPVVLAYPIFLVIFGRGVWTVVAIGVAASTTPVSLKSLEGLSGVSRTLIDVGRSLKLSPFQIFWKIRLPAALPSIFIGLRLGMTICLITVVAVEYLVSTGGLGQLINELAELYDLPGVFATLVFVILASIGFFKIVERFEKWAPPA